MSSGKTIDKICIVAVVLTTVIALIFCSMQIFGEQTVSRVMGYESRIFDSSRVHTIDIVMDDWDSFIQNCENEEYAVCSAVIDGEAYKNIAIRAKGNTSLSSVKNMDSTRYSFKLEFDHYDSTGSYHGLDKLCLNNIIQDNTYMKDYIAYTLMGRFGVNAPLCSFVYITVNNEDWGLYLAVESIEESFLQRNFGNNYGELYKPDSMSFGGGRGNGRDFSMNDFMEKFSSDSENADSAENTSDPESGTRFPMQGRGGGNMPDFANGNMPQDGNMPDFANGNMPDFANGNMPQDGNMPDFANGNMPDFQNENMPQSPNGENSSDTDNANARGMGGFGGIGGMGGMGSDDVKLKYIDDDPDSYSNIFDNAKTAVSDADKKRLINSLKILSESSDVSDAVNVEEVIRYFVVHDFLCNGDSYTGSMIHNYYLYEKDGALSMIPWDYNLAFGSFQSSDASSSVNSPIDTPVSGGMSDRPMIAWIFADEEYTKLYHELMSEFLDSTDLAALISQTADMIAKYVEKDPTKFCTYEEFEKGVEAMKEFCSLRAESVRGQLDGSIPSTTDGQTADSSSLIDASSLNISDMGSMGNNGGPNGGGFNGGGRPDRDMSSSEGSETSDGAGSFGTPPDPAENAPEGFDPSNFGGQFPPQGENIPSADSAAGDPDSPDTRTNDSSPRSRFGVPDSMNVVGGGSSDAVILIGASAGLLITGLLAVILFRRRKR